MFRDFMSFLRDLWNQDYLTWRKLRQELWITILVLIAILVAFVFWASIDEPEFWIFSLIAGLIDLFRWIGKMLWG